MEKWNRRKRPDRLERRFEFDDYDGTRDFLDCLGEYCEEEKRFPDISFGKKYVNITLRPEDSDSELTDSDLKFASEIDGLIN